MEQWARLECVVEPFLGQDSLSFEENVAGDPDSRAAYSAAIHVLTFLSHCALTHAQLTQFSFECSKVGKGAAWNDLSRSSMTSGFLSKCFLCVSKELRGAG